MAKKNNKNSNENKNNKVISNEEIETIKSKIEGIIKQLEADQNKLFSNKKNKELIAKQISDLKRYIDEEQYYLLRDKINALEKMEQEEKKEKLEKESATKKIKTNLSPSNIAKSIKEFDRWPVYSRIKRINQDCTGKEKIQKTIFVFLIFFLLIILMIIGILLITNVIPYSISADTTKIGPWIIFSLPLAMLFFL